MELKIKILIIIVQIKKLVYLETQNLCLETSSLFLENPAIKTIIKIREVVHYLDKLTIMILFYSEKEIRRIKNLNLREDYLAKVLYSDKNRIMIIIIMDLFLEVVVIIILIKVTKIKEGYLVDKHHLYLEVIITIIKNKKLQIYLEDLHFSLIILMVKITKAIILEDYFLD